MGLAQIIVLRGMIEVAIEIVKPSKISHHTTEDCKLV